MPVLLLAQGDARAKDMLRKAIEGRYGLRPPALESLKLQLKGRAPAKVGPITTWVPFEAVTQFRFPRSLRWDYTVKMVGVQFANGLEVFDGVNYHSMQSGKPLEVSDNAGMVTSMQRRLWSVAALFLTPLGEQYSKLEAKSDKELQVTHTQLNSVVTLHLRADQSLEYVETSCLNPDTQKEQLYTVMLSEDQVSLNDVILPAKISAFWDDDPFFEAHPTLVELNPAIPDNVFTLERV